MAEEFNPEKARVLVEQLDDPWSADDGLPAKGKAPTWCGIYMQEAKQTLTAALDENERLRKAITDARDVVTMELNPSNYDHEDACELNSQMIEADGILRAALKGT